MKKIICLYPLEQLALILSEPSGIFYYNQVGGCSCRQEEAEGVLVFVEDSGKKLHKNLTDYSIEIHRGWLTELREKDADDLDSLFANSEKTNYLRVDRSKLKESKEAWIHVVFEPGLPEDERKYCEGYPLSGGVYCAGFSSKCGILTWDNSD